MNDFLEPKELNKVASKKAMESVEVFIRLKGAEMSFSEASEFDELRPNFEAMYVTGYTTGYADSYEQSMEDESDARARSGADLRRLRAMKRWALLATIRDANKARHETHASKEESELAESVWEKLVEKLPVFVDAVLDDDEEDVRAEKYNKKMTAVVHAAVKWREARRALPDAQLSGDPDDEVVAGAFYDTAIQELQDTVSELQGP